MFSAELIKIICRKRTVISRKSVSGPGGEIPCLKVLDVFENLPMKRTLWLDSDGFEVKSSDPSPFGEMTARLTEKDEALAPPSEVIRNLKGTCTEYVMLLTALARAAGVPSRYLF